MLILFGCPIVNFLKDLGIGATGKGVGGLAEADSPLFQTIRDPVVLIQAHPRREGQVRTDPDEHASPLAVVDIEVVLVDPSLLQLQMPAVFLLCSDRGDDARRFPRFQDADHLVRLGSCEVGKNEVIAPAFRCI